MVETEESGIEELRRVVRVAGMTNESAFDDFTAEQVIKIMRACWGSKWDVFPDNLTREEREYAAEHGKLSDECNARLDKELA